MSQLHDFSDPATAEDDKKYWYEFYERDPVGADAARVTLLRARMKAQTDARIAAAPEHLRDEITAQRRIKDEDLYLKIFWRMQETNAARTPEERIAIAARHLEEDLTQMRKAWEGLAYVLQRM